MRCTVSWQRGRRRASDGGRRSATWTSARSTCSPSPTPADAPQRSELESRILRGGGAAGQRDRVTISYDTTGLSAGTVGFPDLLTAAERCATCSTRPRRWHRRTSPARDDAAAAGGSTDLAELSGRRAAALVQRLTRPALQTAIGGLPTAPQPVRDALLAAAGYGITGAVPVPRRGRRRPHHARQQRARPDAAAASDGGCRPRCRRPTADAARGGDHRACSARPSSCCRTSRRRTPPTLQTRFAQSAAMRAADPQALDRWLLQLSHMRPAGERLDFALAPAELLGAIAAAR